MEKHHGRGRSRRGRKKTLSRVFEIKATAAAVCLTGLVCPSRVHIMNRQSGDGGVAMSDTAVNEATASEATASGVTTRRET